MQHLLIVRGLPGSGKSTLAKSLGRMHFEADMFMVDEEGNYSYDHTRLKECHDKCFNAVKAALEEGHDVVVANTFSRLWEMERYFKLPFPKNVVVCEGKYGNVHNVPADKIAQIKSRWQKVFKVPAYE